MGNQAEGGAAGANKQRERRQDTWSTRRGAIHGGTMASQGPQAPFDPSQAPTGWLGAGQSGLVVPVRLFCLGDIRHRSIINHPRSPSRPKWDQFATSPSSVHRRSTLIKKRPWQHGYIHVPAQSCQQKSYVQIRRLAVFFLVSFSPSAPRHTKYL